MFLRFKSFIKNYFGFLFAFFLVILSIIVWNYAFSLNNRNLKFAVLDIGQGDAIFIESPSGNQIIFDGGPGDALLKQILKQISFFDRNIDMIVVTNPDRDHFEGFIGLLDSYSVPVFVSSGVSADENPVYRELLKKVDENKMVKVVARRGQRIDIGGGAYIDILFPDRGGIENLGHNDGSLVAKLVYGETSFLLTGDSTEKIEKYLVENYPNSLESTLLKVAHHGSKTSTSPVFVETVSPEIAVISAGRDNSYGHPHKETLQTLEKNKIPVLGTYNERTIVFESDGKKLFRR